MVPKEAVELIKPRAARANARRIRSPTSRSSESMASLKKLLQPAMLITCMLSVGIVWVRILTDRESRSLYSVSRSLLVEQRQYQLKAGVLPRQRINEIRLALPLPLSSASALSTSPPPSNKNQMQPANVKKLDHEVIHIVLTSWGSNVTRDTALLLKSILLYRRSTLHFHILADQLATTVLSELMRTWKLHKVTYSFYNLEELKAGYARDRIGQLGYAWRLLVHLALPEALPLDVAKVLVVNSDRMVTADVRELWAMFSQFEAGHCIGAVTSHQGKSISLGVMQMHLARMRALGWSKKWEDLKHSMLDANSNGVLLTEQNVADFLTATFPDSTYSLPCQYNYQLTHSPDVCELSAKQVKVVEVVSNHVPSRFWKTFLKVVRYDGNLLRKPAALACEAEDDEDLDDEFEPNTQQMKLVDTYGNAICKDYVRELIGTFRTHLFYLGSDYGVTDEYDVTLVTQLSISRVNTLEKLCTQWKGPMSIAIYLSDSDTMHFVSYVLSSKVFASRKNIVFHLLFEDGSLYPTNHLRNTAASKVKTSHVFVLDVDFMPDPHLYDNLRRAIKLDRLNSEKLALLVPAFETDDYSLAFPDTKQRIIPHLESGVVYPFRNKTFARGHLPTNYTAWKSASEPYEVIWKEGFEPYFVMRTKDLPKYRENFMGYGMNKIVHIMEVTAMGFNFLVMPDSYILHLPHAETFERVRHSSSQDIKKCMKMLEEDVARELLTKYGNDALNGWRPRRSPRPAPQAAKGPAAVPLRSKPA